MRRVLCEKHFTLLAERMVRRVIALGYRTPDEAFNVLKNGTLREGTALLDAYKKELGRLPDCKVCAFANSIAEGARV